MLVAQPKQRIVISDKPLDMPALCADALNNQGESGAVVTFTGAVRVSEAEKGLTALSLEHYPGMTEKQLQKILDQAQARWHLTLMVVEHRVGLLAPGEPIVFVATAALHRAEAFAAAEFIMDYLKQRATFWKKEHYGREQRWVEAKQSDQDALNRWAKTER